MSWFFTPKEVHSIHGIRHLLRVGIYSLILAKLAGFKQSLFFSALIAGLFHDVRRKDSKRDEGHGKRAAQWVQSHIGDITDHLGIKLSGEAVEQIYYAIYSHEIPYSQLIEKPFYKKHKFLIDLLKTADALDRYRLPKLKWWINDEHLEFVPPDFLKVFSYYLVVMSEKNYLDGQNNEESVRKALMVLLENIHQ